MKINKGALSAGMMLLIAAGAGAPEMMAEFQAEKEGTSLTAYQDAGGVWTICGGVTRVNGRPVIDGQKLTREQCDKIDRAAQAKALTWVDKNIRVSLTEAQKVGIASFCAWNIGPGKCFTSTFYKKLNAGDRKGACAEIKRWIYDGGRDCRVRSNNCYGQILRRQQESELACWGLDS